MKRMNKGTKRQVTRNNETSRTNTFAETIKINRIKRRYTNTSKTILYFKEHYVLIVKIYKARPEHKQERQGKFNQF